MLIWWYTDLKCNPTQYQIDNSIMSTKESLYKFVYILLRGLFCWKSNRFCFATVVSMMMMKVRVSPAHAGMPIRTTAKGSVKMSKTQYTHTHTLAFFHSRCLGYKNSHFECLRIGISITHPLTLSQGSQQIRSNYLQKCWPWWRLCRLLTAWDLLGLHASLWLHLLWFLWRTLELNSSIHLNSSF